MRSERDAHLEATAATASSLRSQISRIKETIDRILNGDTTLAQKLQTLFREQGVIILIILTTIGLTISTLVLALTGGGGGVSTAPKRNQHRQKEHRRNRHRQKSLL